ncbi:unnamed protein product, partial [Staurois parvus]
MKEPGGGELCCVLWDLPASLPTLADRMGLHIPPPPLLLPGDQQPLEEGEEREGGGEERREREEMEREGRERGKERE